MNPAANTGIVFIGLNDPFIEWANINPLTDPTYANLRTLCKNPFYSDQMSLLHKSPVDQNHFHILQQDGEDLDPNRGQRDIEYCRGLKEEGKFRLIVVAL